MKSLLNLLCSMVLTSIMHAQSPVTPPCASNPAYRQFDFWVGDWEVYGMLNKNKGKKAGESHVQRILDSCVIVENWTSAGGNYSGKSYNTFLSSTGKWQQYWVDDKGGVTHYTDGHYADGKMVFLTDDLVQPDGTRKWMRLSFYNLGPDKVRQHGEHSTDSGKTWTTDYDLEYRRINR
ncbi:MAG TPA: hypothetical protein VG842_10865 [Sediminibacterium sp.]|nr:hypothetical protein [Sediminibacterium sp.]